MIIILCGRNPKMDGLMKMRDGSYSDFHILQYCMAEKSSLIMSFHQ